MESLLGEEKARRVSSSSPRPDKVNLPLVRCNGRGKTLVRECKVNLCRRTCVLIQELELISPEFCVLGSVSLSPCSRIVDHVWPSLPSISSLNLGAPETQHQHSRTVTETTQTLEKSRGYWRRNCGRHKRVCRCTRAPGCCCGQSSGSLHVVNVAYTTLVEIR